MPLTKIISDMLTFGGAVEGDVLSFIGNKWIPKKVSGVPAGAMMSFAGGTAPEDWLLCDGSAIDRTTYAALFTAIGTSFGIGDGSTTFNLPDFRGRTPVGMDNMGGSSANRITNAQADALGGTGGAENKASTGTVGNTSLSSSQIPSHNHWQTARYGYSSGGLTQAITASDGGVGCATTQWPAAASSGLTSCSRANDPAYGVFTQNTGGGGSHNHTFTGSNIDVTQPWLACNMIIKI